MNSVVITGNRREPQARNAPDVLRTWGTLFSPGVPLKVSAILLIPMFYNPMSDGKRAPVEAAKIAETEREIQQRFSGYSRFLIDGWYRDESTGEEFWDRLLRFEIDFPLDEDALAFLKSWKASLARRFDQREIYMKLNGPIVSW